MRFAVHKRSTSLEKFYLGLLKSADESLKRAGKVSKDLAVRGGAPNATVAEIQGYTAALHQETIAAHHLLTLQLLRLAFGESVTLKIIVIHHLHAIKKDKKPIDETGLAMMLGDHGLRLHSVEEKFEDFDKRVSGTLGDLYSRLAGGKRLESEK